MEGLHLSQVSSGYNHKVVVRNCSLQVGPKETLVLMGPSGSGKSTLLLTVLGAILPFSGAIMLDEQEISLMEMAQRNIGYLPQDYGLFPHMSVAENIAFGLRVRGVSKSEQQKVVDQMLRLVQLEGYSRRRIGELSGGEKQRVALARALAVEPKLLLLDEPLSNIDQVTKKEVASDLKELFARLAIPVILVTHSIEDAAFLSQKLAIMINGVIEQTGTLQEVRKSPRTDFIRRLVYPFA